MSKKRTRKPENNGPIKAHSKPENGEATARSQKRAATKTAAPASAARRWWLEIAVLLPAVILGAALFFNAVHGEFVYDDQRQIVRNSLIQDSSQVWKALTSDVWAFKGSGIAASNYWRPTFVAWMIVNFRMFGIDQARPWHITNIILNVGVIILAFALMRRFGLSPLVAGAIALIFAAHPVHTESVAWISGSPDLLMSLALLGSLWFVLSLRERGTREHWFLALALYAVALGAKEVAILYPVAVFAVFWRPPGADESRGLPAPEATMRCAPFVVFAVIFFVVRIGVLGQFAQAPLDAASPGSAILTVPSVFAFYLRQIVFPYWIGPSYPLRAVTWHTLGVTNFVLPLLVSAAALVLLFRMARHSMAQRVGLALFLLTLTPAMNIGGFQPEQLVHDRYLYLPLLGFLMVTIPELVRLLARWVLPVGQRAELAVLVFALLVSVPLGWQTVHNNRAWLSNLALWERSIRSDPYSSFNYQQYGAELLELSRYDDALRAYDNSIAISPNATALMGRGRGYFYKQKYDLAEADYRSVIALPNERVALYTIYQAYEGLAITYQKLGRLDEAITLLKQGRERLYPYAAAMTEKLAVILYGQNRKIEAMTELEHNRNQAETETLPESKIVYMRLGALYAEMNRPEDARTALQRYLTITQGLQDPQTKDARKQTNQLLQQLAKK